MKNKTIVVLSLAILLAAPLAANARKFVQCVGSAGMTYITNSDGVVIATSWVAEHPDCV